jgi:hypothetical protein
MRNERKMPERWYELLREWMQVEQLRMRIVKHGYLIEDDQLQELLTEAHSLDAEMLLVMRQAIAEVWRAKKWLFWQIKGAPNSDQCQLACLPRSAPPRCVRSSYARS